ncbi:unnamed protein product [Spirodela intermedia]|uniref:Uncharacterized protein n=1 Tax=Spirodela intermedia TaxID=51605 RepID=A0A7I8I8G1_SPIIN|nr:unnamed protein product [Spirodela intermedia]CAA6653788.1 unnamed protein product [Spirodela intermedia]
MANASPIPPIYMAPRTGSSAICPRSLRFCGGFSSHFRHRRKKVCAQAVAPSPRSPPINADYLEREFGGHGATFRGIGTAVCLVLPGGLITSYRPQMWHGSSVEVLHTSVSEGDGGGVAIQGGVSIDFTCGSDGEVPRWSPRAWDLRDVRGSPQSSIQVELVSCDPDGRAEVKHLVTFQQDLLASDLAITNRSGSPLRLVGSIVSHLKVSTPDATYAVGLEGSNYRSRPPLGSNFSIVPPGFSLRRPSDGGKSWGSKALLGFFSTVGQNTEALGTSGEEEPEESSGEEDDNYTQLTEKMSRIYTSAPRVFTIIDRGRRNSVVVERRGFDELYLFSPGSDHESYGKYSYISTGSSAILKPVIVSPEGVWRGGQYLHNPNT